MEITLYLLIGLVAGVACTAVAMKMMANSAINRSKFEAEQLRNNAQSEAQNKAKEIELAARQEQLKRKEQFEKETEKDRNELKSLEARLAKREDNLDRKLDTLSVKEKHLDDQDAKIAQREKSLAGKEDELSKTLREQRDRLLQLTSLTPEQAREMLLKRIEDDCKLEAGAIIQRISEQTQDEAKEKSRQIILQAIQRYAAEQVADHTVSTVTIPTDDMKGRVIGREGRNIRAFEKATGVDVIIDDTPGVVVVSCFDPVRREIARISLDRLVQDGRIHPARIEEVVTTTTKEMDEELIRLGKEAAQEANLQVAKPVIPMLGRLAFRTSYGQNVLKHSLEVAYLSQVIADELGLDGNLARRAGLLHDIGKALDHEQEGAHPQLGKEFLRRLDEPEAVLNTAIIMAADAMSASRPGARRESLERYVKRLQELEDLAMTFEGVRQAYAIQAGREVRVIVDAKLVDDRISAKIAHDIAQKIEQELNYPGEIKVTLIREVRSVEYAR
jgi:ribonuclease Y